MAGSNGTGNPVVKTEPFGYDGAVKAEPRSLPGTPSGGYDDDIYEDAGDLDFAKAAQNVWLMRLPKYVYDNWAQIDDDEEIRLGTVRVEPKGNGENEISLLLATTHQANKGLPREYSMAVTNTATTNMFIFTEQDAQTRGKGKAAVGARSNNKSDKSQNHLAPPDRRQWEKYSRYHPYVRKPIPKQTALVGAVKHEVNCLPVENAEFNRIMAERNREALRPKHKTVVVPINALKEDLNLLAPGTIGAAGFMESFIKTANTKSSKSGQDNKAARMPRNELLDAIFECFRKYNYWSLKSMKAHLNQPESYLKQVLEDVAVLVRSGQFAMTYTLKPENKQNGVVLPDTMAPEQSMGFDGASDRGEDLEDDMKLEDDDEDDVKMED